jgi:hypothetical protein
MIKILLAAIASVMLWSDVSQADILEHNYKAQKDDWTYTYRHREGTWHTELGKKVKDVNVMYRFAELNGTIENRIKFTHNLFQHKFLKLDHRIEYRHFNNKESHWRYRFILSAEHKISDTVSLWAKIQPRVSFKNETQFDSRDQFGLKFKHGKLSISPFIERGGTEDYRYKQTVIGTHLKYKI